MPRTPNFDRTPPDGATLPTGTPPAHSDIALTSGTTVAATASRDDFEISSLAASGAVITGFTLGQDKVEIHDSSVAASTLATRLSLVVSGGSTNIVVDAGTSSAHTLVTLQGVAATTLADVVALPPTPPNQIAVTASNQTVAGTTAADLFVFSSSTQSGDVISGFALGTDRIAIAGLGRDLGSHLSLVAGADGTSTSLVVDAGTSTAHTLVTLAGVVTSDLGALLGHGAGDNHPGFAHG